MRRRYWPTKPGRRCVGSADGLLEPREGGAMARRRSGTVAAVTAGLVLALTGCNIRVGTGAFNGGGPTIQGSGVEKSESRPVSGVSAVSLSGIGRVVIQQTGK